MKFWMLSVLICACAPAEAGPWLKPKGAGFLSVGQQVEVDPATLAFSASQNLYLEYGWSAATTLVAKVNLSDQHRVSPQIAVRRAIPTAHDHLKLAYELGLGADVALDQMPISPLPFAHLGLSVGRGLSMGDQNGWAVLDTALKLQKDVPPTIKLEATIGLSTKGDWKWMAQATADISQDRWKIAIGPSVAIPLFKNNHLQLGASYVEGGVSPYSMQVNLWRSF